MTSGPDDLRLAADFAPASYDDWRKLVDGVLKGAPFEKLVGKTYDGLRIEPIYRRARDAAPIAGRPAAAPWQIMQRIDHPDAATANAQALHDLENGATGLDIEFAGGSGARGFGVADATRETLAKLFDGVFFDAGIAIALNPVLGRDNAGTNLADLIEARGVDPADVDLRINYQALTTMAVRGAAPAPWPEMAPPFAKVVGDLMARGFKGPFVLADGRPIHDAGGSEVQELGFALAVAVAYLRMLEAAGIALDRASAALSFRLCADADQFLTMAKFRALRLLWARVEQSCGLTPRPVFVAAETSWRMLTQRDAYVNMLRATIATFSAGLGGANAITVLPHTQALGLPDPFARRVARNTQLVLLEESNLAKVSDPAAGSGGIETLTQQLCEAAWSLFQEIEQAGGVFAALEQNLIQRKVAATRALREANIIRRKEVLTGASEFPNLHEAPVAVLDARPAAPAPYGEAKIKFEALPPMRLAAPFEASARPLGSNAETARRAAKGVSRQSRHARRLHRAGDLCQELFRDRRHRGRRYRGIYRSGSARRRVQGLRCGPGLPVLVRQDLCRTGSGGRQGPSSRRRQTISIWQGGPASRKPRSAPPASTNFIFAGGDALTILQEACRLME